MSLSHPITNHIASQNTMYLNNTKQIQRGVVFLAGVMYLILMTLSDTTDKRTDLWSRDFIIWKINFGLWAVGLGWTVE